jgi:hypothetical protein
MKIWRLAIPAVIIVLAAAGINGCYTMLLHPPVEKMDEITGLNNTAEVNHGERCTDCHTGNIHGSPAGIGDAGRSGGYNDYDPYWGNDYNGYYDPWFMGSSRYSPYFYDSYYQYNTVPWWQYYSISSRDRGSEGHAAPREKPVRRGGNITNERRGNTPPSMGSIPGSSGAEKPSPQSPKQDGSSDENDSEKQKPVRRGGIK